MKPNIVIYADYLIKGNVEIFDENKHLIFHRNIDDESLVNIKIIKPAQTKFNITVTTQTEKIKKTL